MVLAAFFGGKGLNVYWLPTPGGRTVPNEQPSLMVCLSVNKGVEGMYRLAGFRMVCAAEQLGLKPVPIKWQFTWPMLSTQCWFAFAGLSCHKTKLSFMWGRLDVQSCPVQIFEEGDPWGSMKKKLSLGSGSPQTRSELRWPVAVA